MGKKRGKRSNTRGRGGRGGRAHYDNRTDNHYWPDIIKVNAQFERYYNELGVVPEDEKETFWRTLRRELPNSFRFTGSKGHALSVQQRLIDHYVPQVAELTFEGAAVPAPTSLEWYPEGLAWSMTTPKQVVRKHPQFAPFQKFLVSETTVGNISRQEVVSMIPPLLIDIRPGMCVLDLCAAPGSKSAQLIEMIHGGEEARVRKVMRKIAQENGREVSPDGAEIAAESAQAESEGDWDDDGRSTGLLIANDVDYRRAQMLVHQVKRLNSPNLIVTNHDATMYPSIKVKSEGSKNSYLKFDRILADVPCSGDGTCRKNINVWKEWTPSNALGLHPTQVRILTRSLQMLKVGGRVVYSTCSMNPIENEAVIAAAIDRCGGLSNVEVIDCSNDLPALIRRPGLQDWKVVDKSGRIWNSWAEVEDAKATEGPVGFARLDETMFPPSTPDGEDRIPLDRAIRIYPHLQDTGAFFIAVLEKKSEIKARPEKPSIKKVPGAVAVANEIDAQTEAGKIPDTMDESPALEAFAPTKYDTENPMDEGNAPPTTRQNRPNMPSVSTKPSKRELEAQSETESSSKRLKTDEDAAAQAMPAPASELAETHREAPKLAPPPLQTSVSKKSNQPQEETFKYLDTEHDVLKNIIDFYDIAPRFPRDRFMVRNPLGDPAKAIYYTSQLARDILTENEGRSMKFVHCGVKMFMKQDAQGQDVCRWRIQAEGLPIIDPWVGESRIVRLYKRPTLRKLLIDMFPRVGRGGWMELGEIGERVRDVSMGCCILRVESSTEEDGFKDRMVIPLWRSLSSLNLMLPKEERKAMLLRLYNDESPLIDTSAERFAKPTNGVVTSAGNEPPTNEPPHAVADLDSASSVDDDDGGVLLPSEPAAASEAAVAGREEEVMQKEDAILAELQNVDEKTVEVAPGVVDEETAFNKTV